MLNSVDRTIIEDGVIISTVCPPFMAWYGNFETAISFDGGNTWSILKGYETLKGAREGHLEYCNMTVEELKLVEKIG